jgi:alpha-1,2-mannosyltransferase
MPVQSRVFLREFENFMTPYADRIHERARCRIAAAGCWWTFWHRRDADLSNALLLTAAFLVTPYAFNYDMVVFGPMITKLMDRDGNTPLDYGLMLAVWALPVLTVALAIAAIPLSFLPLAGLAARLL